MLTEEERATYEEGMNKVIEYDDFGEIKNMLDVVGCYDTIAHGKSIDTMAIVSSKGEKADKLTGKLFIQENGVQYTIDNFVKLARTLTVNTHKLMTAGIARLVTVNHTGAQNSTNQQYRVLIPLVEYARQCYPDRMMERVTNTDAEAEREQKRLKNALKDIRKDIVAEVETLGSIMMTWQEKDQGKPCDFLNMRILSTYGIRHGKIILEFTPGFTKYVTQRPLMQYPVALRRISAKKPNAYRAGVKLAMQYSMDNNIKRRTNNRLKVTTILEWMKLPSIENIRKSGQSWIYKIKIPFEDALDELARAGYLSPVDGWRYCKSGGKPMTDAEASFATYEDWSQAMVIFRPQAFPDQTQRLQRKADKIQKLKEKAARKQKQRTRNKA